MPSSPHGSARRLASVAAVLFLSALAVPALAAPRKTTASVAPRVAPLRVAPAPVEADKPAAEADTGGIFGPVRIGPLAGASLPRPVSLALFLKYKRAIGVGLEYSFLPTMTVEGV